MRWLAASILTLSTVPRRLKFACFASVGACIGAGLYVARVSEATSYLSDDPKVCINCHIMAPEYASWQHSSHARVATCNDCLVPHDNVISKLYYKAKDGSRHSALFTLRRERQVIFAIPESRKVIQRNCERCHSRTLQPIAQHSGTDRSCTDCHREVPHGRTHSLSATPNAAVPPLSPVLLPLTRQSKEGPR
jgi:cytochrome c nitrite reductase small subunit